jgi:hypothetical protein
LFLQDYSGFTRAAEIQAQGLQNLGQNIAGGIEKVGDYFKEQGNKKKLIKQSDVQIDAALTLFPDLTPTLQDVRDKIRDENIPLNDRAAIAESVAGLINMGTNQMRFQAERNLKLAELAARSAPEGPKPTTYKPSTIDVGGQKLYVAVGSDGYYYDPQTKTPILDLDAYAKGQPPEVYGGAMGGGMGGGQFLTEADMIPLPGADMAPENQRASEIMNALGFSPMQAGGLEPGIAGPVIPDLTSPTADPEQIQAVLNADADQGVLPPIDQPQVQPQAQAAPKSRLIGQPKDTSTFRPATPEEVQVYGSQGQIDTQTGRFYPIRPPSGMSIESTPGGGFRVVQGAGVKGEGVKQAQEQLSRENLRIISSTTDEAFTLLDRVGTDNPLVAAGNAALAKALPASETGQLQTFFERLNGENSFERMRSLRASSPTGGGPGSMTEKEWPRFEDRYYRLNVNATKDALEKGLSLNMLNSFEAANGTPDDVIKSLKEKKITQQQFDSYVRDYVTTRNIARVNASGVPGKANDWTKLNKTLINLSTDFEAPSAGADPNPDLKTKADAVLEDVRRMATENQ